MKSICFFNTTKFFGGGEKVHFEYAKELSKLAGYRISFVVAKNSHLSKKVQIANFDCFYISLGQGSIFNIAKLLQLKNYFYDNAIDTVVLNSSIDIKAAGIAAKMAKVKNIIYRRGLAAPIKNSVTNRIVFHKILTHVIVNSKATMSFVKNIGVPNEKISLIYNGISLIDDKSISEKNQIVTGYESFYNRKFILGNVGRLVKQKGQHHLIAIAKILKQKKINFEILIAGDGYLLDTLSKLIDTNNLKNEVKLIGFQDNVEEFMQSIDIFLLTSAWEGFGLAIAEAMKNKKPVVAFNVSSNAELIEDGSTGFLVTKENTSEFAKKIEILLNNINLITQFGQAGYLKIKNEFNIETSIKQLEKII